MRNETSFQESDFSTEETIYSPELEGDDVDELVELGGRYEEQEHLSELQEEGETQTQEGEQEKPSVESLIFNDVYSSRGGSAEHWKEGSYHQTYEFRDGKLWYLNGECFTDQIRQSGHAEGIEEHELWLDHLRERPEEPFSSTTTDYIDDTGALHTYGAVSDGTFIQSRHFIYAEAKEAPSFEGGIDTEDTQLIHEEVVKQDGHEVHTEEVSITDTEKNVFAAEGVEHADVAQSTGTQEEDSSVEQVDMGFESRAAVARPEEARKEAVEEVPYAPSAVQELVSAVPQTESMRDAITEDKNETPPISFEKEEQVSEECLVEEPEVAQVQEKKVQQEAVLPATIDAVVPHEQTIVTPPAEKVDATPAAESINEVIKENEPSTSAIDSKNNSENSSTEYLAPEKSIQKVVMTEAPTEEKVLSDAIAVSEAPKEIAREQNEIIESNTFEKRTVEKLVAETATTETQQAQDRVELVAEKASAETGNDGVKEDIREKIAEKSEEKTEPLEEVKRNEMASAVLERQPAAVEESAEPAPAIEEKIEGVQEVLTEKLNELFAGDIINDSREQTTEPREVRGSRIEAASISQVEKQAMPSGVSVREEGMGRGVAPARATTVAAYAATQVANDVDSGNGPVTHIAARNGVRMERAIAA